MRQIYVASSWRNTRQHDVVSALRWMGHEVYDFKNPKPGDDGFRWSEIDPDWQKWSASQYCDALAHPIAKAGFTSDFEAMQWADTGVLLLPCGRSAHLEAGWFVGNGKPLFILLEGQNEPELMYRMATGIATNLPDLINALGRREGRIFAPEKIPADGATA